MGQVGQALGYVSLIWYASLTSIALCGYYCTLFCYNRRNGRQAPDSSSSADEQAPLTSTENDGALQGVSILRPMRGLETLLEECLTSSFQQRFPVDKFEILLSVAQEDDPAVAIARRVMAAFPHIQSKLIIGDRPEVGPNPKIANLVRSWDQAQFGIRWILDSNVLVHPDTLRAAALHFEKQEVNLVHHLPVAVALPEAALGARLDALYLSTLHAKMYAVINRVGIAPCVMGKSNLIRASALDSPASVQTDGESGNSLARFAKYIAEDHLIATAVWQGPASHVLDHDYCVLQPLQQISLWDFLARRARWIRVRKYMVMASTLTEPFTECLVLGLVGALGMHAVFGISRRAWFAVHVLTSCALDFIQLRSLQQTGPAVPTPAQQPMSTWSFLLLWLLREVSALPTWFWAMSHDKISWRGKQFVMRRDLTAVRAS